jgi:ATP-dependent 26S proteasome regulatory subunit
MQTTQGFVARDLVQLFHRANGMIHVDVDSDSDSHRIISFDIETLKSIFDRACHSVIPSELQDLSTIVSVSETTENVCGYRWLMNRILKLMRISFLQSEDQKEADHLGVGRTKGIFLFGPSGCGKTHMIRCIAGEINASFVEVRSYGVTFDI